MLAFAAGRTIHEITRNDTKKFLLVSVISWIVQQFRNANQQLRDTRNEERGF
jgi:hypothetical protein